jgi:hypothetical protein
MINRKYWIDLLNDVTLRFILSMESFEIVV